MEHFDLAQSFVEQCTRAERVEELASAFERVIERLGFRHFACCSHTNPLDPGPQAVMLHNYPSAWVRQFAEMRLHEIDPVFVYAERSLPPFFWDAPEFLDSLTVPQRNVLNEARRFGLTRGYTIPIHLPWAPGVVPASCSLVLDAGPIDARSFSAVHLMAMYLYGAAARLDGFGSPAAQPQDVLSVRERQCLELAAQGKSDWAAGRLLGISERTVHNHIEHAKRRLGVTTRVQAIVQALIGRQISFGDALRAEPAESQARRRRTRRLPSA